jgi:DNA (cytosine-5)-methyltransferase 1
MKSISSTRRLKSVDLFCGAGGIAEGFRQAGFDCLYGNDINPDAMATFHLNHPDAVADTRSIEDIDVAAIRRQLKLRKGELDALVGGPPCQGFSINAPGRFLEDARNALFNHYIRFLEEFRPKTLMFENVPGMLSIADGGIFQEIMSEISARGYQLSAQILFAAHYGVPQERWRVIILGSRDGYAPLHPMPTHNALGRANFRGGRAMTFNPLPLERNFLKPVVTVEQAIADLPRLKMGEGAEEMRYSRSPHSPYAHAMRKDSLCVFNHFAPQLSAQNIERLKHIKPGGSWRDIPHHLLPKGMQAARRSDHTKRYGRLRPDSPAGTVMTKCDPHWGAVFLPDQDRSLTVREAARLQSFPDSYRFLGPRVAQYVQVGNAVPVLLARAVGRALNDHLLISGRNASELECLSA